jgi:N-acetyl-alpha-D-muramate 1-phosphate uridylyltransferase
MKAMILAAGFGSRLGALTKDTPKCLMQVGGIPILEHVFNKLIEANIKDVVINLHYLSHKITQFLKSKNNFNLNISYSYEENLLGTGGAILNAQKYLGEEDDILIYNSDVLCSVDLLKLFEAHSSLMSPVTLAVMNRETSRPLLFAKDGENSLVMCGWQNFDSNQGEYLVPYATTIKRAFSGIHIISPICFSSYSSFSYPFSSISVYMEMARRGNKISGFDLGSVDWIDIGTPERLAAANEKS